MPGARVPGCPAPSITTVGGDRRHHFRHLRKDAATEHGPETWHHIESKEVVAEWAPTRYPNAVVELEKVLAAGARIADVFVTFPDGTRFAIEVQFSSLPVEKFRERHSWYRHAGIVDVWLFIHAGVHLRAGWDDIVRVELSPVHRAALDETGRLLGVNPILRRAGYGTGQLSLGRRTWTTHPQPGSEAPFTTEPLDSFILAEGGMTSAALEQLDANTSTALAAIDAAARARAEADRQREVARQARVRAAQDRAGARTANAERTAPRNTELLTRWETSPEGASALEYFGGLILPDWFVDDGDLQIGIPARIWKWRLIRTVVVPLRPEEMVTASKLLRELALTYPRTFPVNATERELRKMLSALETEGVLDRVPGQHGYYVAKQTTGSGVADAPPEKCVVCGGQISKEFPHRRTHFGRCERQAHTAGMP